MAEAVLELGQFDPLRVDGGNDFVELLLRRDDDPAGGDDLAGFQQVLADLAELLHGGTQVFDLVAAAGDVLPHFVDDEDQGLAGAAAAPSSKVRSTTLLTVIDGVPVRWECAHESAEG